VTASPALRLIVVWMAGALFTAVVYRAHQWEEVGHVPKPPPPAAPVPIREGQLGAINRYMQARYDAIEHTRDGAVITGWAYIRGDGSLIEVRNEVLRQFLPERRFFRASLVGVCTETMSVLVSFHRAPGGDEISTCALSLGYPSREFLSQFIGVPAPISLARRQLALAIANLLAEPEAWSQARVPSHYVGEARAELWYGDAHAFDVDLTVDQAGHVDSIAIWNPLEGRVEATATAL